MIRKIGLGCGGLFLIVIVLAIISSASGGGSGASKTATAPVQAQATTGPAAAIAQTAPATVAAKPTTVAAKPTTADAASANQGITFGKPVKVSMGSLDSVILLATNATDRVKSFTVKATYKTGSTIAATAIGAVNDLRAHETRAVTLITTSPIPSAFDSVRVDVDTMLVDAASTKGGDAATNLRFGEPTVKSLGSMTTIDVEVTNGDAAAHSLTVQAAFLKGEELVAVAVGAVNDLAAGQTKTASLLSAGAIPAHDRILMATETIVK